MDTGTPSEGSKFSGTLATTFGRGWKREHRRCSTRIMKQRTKRERFVLVLRVVENVDTLVLCFSHLMFFQFGGKHISLSKNMCTSKQLCPNMEICVASQWQGFAFCMGICM